MGFVVEGYVQPRREPHVIRSAEEMAAFVAAVLSESAEFPQQANLYVTEGRPPLGNGLPDHQLTIGLNRDRQLGSVSYTGPSPEPGGTWYSKGERVNPDGVVYEFFGNEHDRPADSEVALELVTQAAVEFLELGGERPTCVQWQPADG